MFFEVKDAEVIILEVKGDVVIIIFEDFFFIAGDSDDDDDVSSVVSVE
jgi:hypothetical protein